MARWICAATAGCANSAHKRSLWRLSSASPERGRNPVRPRLRSPEAAADSEAEAVVASSRVDGDAVHVHPDAQVVRTAPRGSVRGAGQARRERRASTGGGREVHAGGAAPRGGQPELQRPAAGAGGGGPAQGALGPGAP